MAVAGRAIFDMVGHQLYYLDAREINFGCSNATTSNNGSTYAITLSRYSILRLSLR